MIIQAIVNIAEICARNKVKYAVISPGSRSAALTLAFARHPDINTLVIPDERSAGFIALGLAQYTRETVALICTSGTATLNYAPAICEAYYQHIPLLVFTADRPPELIDQYDGQTIRQEYIFKNHIKASYNIHPDSYDKNLVFSVYQQVQEAIMECTNDIFGPVHVNVPVREPFYPQVDEVMEFGKDLVLKPTPDFYEEDEEFVDYKNVINDIQKHERVLVVVGQAYPGELPESLMQKLQSLRIPVVAEPLSNVPGDYTFGLFDWYIDGMTHEELAPDVLLTFGKTVTSKKLKQFLKMADIAAHYHFGKEHFTPDPYETLTDHLQIDAKEAGERIIGSVKGVKNEEYIEQWLKVESQCYVKIQEVLPHQPFSELSVYYKLFQHINPGCVLHFANSMAVRYGNLLLSVFQPNTEVYSNRGASGIDGCTGTAVGSAIASERPTIFFTGDLAFFYDRNSLWHPHIPKNIKIVLMNNHGGGIFGMLPAPASLPELDQYFETPHPLNARNTANDFGLGYYFCKSEEELHTQWSKFIEEDGPAIFEIETSGAVNKEVFKSVRKKLMI